MISISFTIEDEAPSQNVRAALDYVAHLNYAFSEGDGAEAVEPQSYSASLVVYGNGAPSTEAGMAIAFTMCDEDSSASYTSDYWIEDGTLRADEDPSYPIMPIV